MVPRSEPPVRINGEALRAIRLRTENPDTPGKAWTVTALAEKCGIGQSHQSLLETGERKASRAVVRREALTLGVPIGALLADWDERTDPIWNDGVAS